MSCDVSCRRGSDLALLWLWRRPAATAPIRLLARKPPYAAGVALKGQKTKQQQQQKKNGFTAICERAGKILIECLPCAKSLT